MVERRMVLVLVLVMMLFASMAAYGAEEKYSNTNGIFISRLARTHRTYSPIAGEGVLDSPNITGCDNPSIFSHEGRLYFMFGDPDGVDKKKSPWYTRNNGALAWIDRIVPEKGIHLEHHRQWLTKDPTSEDWDLDENEFPDVKPIISPYNEDVRANNTGGAIVELDGGGQRIWFATYGYSSNPAVETSLHFIYSDDNFATEAVHDEALLLWDAQDSSAINGSYGVKVFLGYSFQRLGDYVYAMISRSAPLGDAILLRASVEDLQKPAEQLSIADWYYLVSVNEQTGEATWSESGLVRGQVSHDPDDDPNTCIPAVPFINPVEPASYSPKLHSTINSVVWNPYMNRWIAARFSNHILNGQDVVLWESTHYWGPYHHVATINHATGSSDHGSYNAFTHEWLLGGNGREIYYGRSRWPDSGYYGTYLFKAEMQDKVKIALSAKSADANDVLTITVTNNSTYTYDKIVTVDGNTATWVSTNGDVHTYTYTITGNENGGSVGVVDVRAEFHQNDVQTNIATRDVALVVNQINDLNCDITSHEDQEEVSGTITIDASAYYDLSPEDLGPGRPEVHIIKTELRNIDANEIVEDADVYGPYSLMLDTTRYGNGLHDFRVIAYDTLDRRGEAAITLDVNNPTYPVATGNLVADGNMEAASVDDWTAVNSATISKISNGQQRSGTQSLLISKTVNMGTYGGVEQTVGDLSGGEQLRFGAWVMLISHVSGAGDKEIFDSLLKWELLDNADNLLGSGELNPYNFFIKVSKEFTNPAGNSQITIRIQIKEDEDSSKIEAIIDDVVLQDASHDLVENPTQLNVVSNGDENALIWDPSDDVNIEYHYVYRKLVTETSDDYVKIGEVERHGCYFVDTGLGGNDYNYGVKAIDFMADGSDEIEEESGDGNGCHNTTKDKWYMTIQAAIDDADDDDEIVVYPGTYYENVDFTGKAIELKSTDPYDWNVVEGTIIDADGTDDVVTFNSGEDSSSVLSGLTIANAGGCGVYCSNSSNPLISNCVITNCSSYGVGCYSSSPTISNNKMSGNYGGVLIRYSASSPEIINNWIFDGGYGMTSFSSGFYTVANNTIVGNTTKGIYHYSGTAPVITNCILWDNGEDLYNCSATYSCIKDSDSEPTNIHTDPNFVDAANDNYHLTLDSLCIDAGYSSGDYGNQIDIDSQPREMVVSVDIGADEAAYLPSSHADYSEWVAVGQPACWAYQRQCCGDADGAAQGKFNYWVHTLDLDVLTAAWNKTFAEIDGQTYNGVELICADFDHAAQGRAQYRVSTGDLDILSTYWQINDGPDPDCFGP
ncbi:right-handed parallel beta-helix repeat-containing protein [Candidatus Pacearchaeota archaeon]|nr:right-handed parallel beta-helix repeat-containing protein [Candidatus Pacearchaeota archaeon]